MTERHVIKSITGTIAGSEEKITFLLSQMPPPYEIMDRYSLQNIKAYLMIYILFIKKYTFANSASYVKKIESNSDIKNITDKSYNDIIEAGNTFYKIQEIVNNDDFTVFNGKGYDFFEETNYVDDNKGDFLDDRQEIGYCDEFLEFHGNSRDTSEMIEYLKMHICEMAASYNRLDILKWAKKNDFNLDYENIVLGAAKNLYFDIIDWCVNNGFPYDENECIEEAKTHKEDEDGYEDGDEIEVIKKIKDIFINKKISCDKKRRRKN